MSRPVRAAVAAFAVLMLIGLAWQVHQLDEWQRTVAPTTFGTVPGGYGALFDLFSELGLPVMRSYDPPQDLPSTATVWWVEPPSACPQRTAVESAVPSSKRSLLAQEWPASEWVTHGGTAVVFLPTGREANEPCAPLAGLVLPARRLAARPENGRGEPDKAAHIVEGRIIPVSRRLEVPELSTFAEAGDWTVIASVDGQPFMLEQPRAQGRVVVVADATFLRNAWLDSGDAAPLALDLVRTYGAPLFDEREHGLRRPQNAWRYIVTSPASGVFVGLALFGFLFAWRGSALPPRQSPDETPVPTMEAFVDSLAALYARTGDHARVLERYRELTAARLRRHFGLHPDTPVHSLLERLRACRHLAPEGMRLLVDGAPVAGEAALRAAVQSLDALVLEATR